MDNKKIFQPKVIIGSVTSFIIAAVGVVAVFFPSLPNLEKKSMQEKAIFLRSQDSIHELYEFLKKNANKPVRLAIAYCSLPSRIEVSDNRGNITKSFKWFENAYNNKIWEQVQKITTYTDHFGVNPRKNLEEELDVVAEAKIANVLDEDHVFVGFDLDSGAIVWDESRSLYKQISIPHSTNKNKKYVWTMGNFEDELLSKLDKDYEKQCPPETTKYGEYEIHEEKMTKIVGTFFVHEQKEGWHVSNLYRLFYSIELEPLDKKDLEMRNY